MKEIDKNTTNSNNEQIEFDFDKEFADMDITNATESSVPEYNKYNKQIPIIDDFLKNFNEEELATYHRLLQSEEYLPNDYYMKREGSDKGLYKREFNKNGKEIESIWVGDCIWILAHTLSTEGNNWGYELCWIDRAGITHNYVLLSNHLQSNKLEWYSDIYAGGWCGDKRELYRFIYAYSSKILHRCTSKIGWYNNSYVLPNQIISIENDENNIVFQKNITQNLYTNSGSREKCSEMLLLTKYNTKLEFGVLCALAGPLLKFADMPSGGFNFEGGSSCGKSTILQCCCSIWGGEDHFNQWRTTDNGLEFLAPLFNDNVLILDELGQASPKVVSESIYMLSTNKGKTRAGGNLNLRSVQHWHLLFLSSGEIGVSTKLMEGGIKAKAGQEVRLIGIPTNKDHVSELHGHSNSAELINKIKELTKNNYGFLGIDFVNYLVENYNEIKSVIHNELTEITNKLSPQDANEQIRRVTRQFALIEYTRRVAIEAEILPLDYGINSVSSCFNDWLNEHESDNVGEVDEVLSTIRLYIEQHGASRFHTGPNCEKDIRFRAGFKKGDYYCFFVEVFKNEVLKGLNLNRSCKVLKNAGWLISEPGRYQKREFFQGKQQLFYAVSIPPDSDSQF